MRLSLPLLTLAAVTLAAAPVRAQDKAGWVDPPAKTEARTAAKPGREILGAQAGPQTQAATQKPAEATADTRATGAAARTAKRPGSPERARQVPDARVAEEAARRGIRSPRRLADTVMRTPAAPARSGASEVETGTPRVASLAGTARGLMSDYLDAVSSEAGMRGSTRFYGDLVRFHGRLMTRSALMAEKARFARRWPDRRYEPRGETRTACDAASATCVVTTPFAFQAANPSRGARSAGVGELALTVGFAGDRPVILSENSRVVRRGAAALATDRSGSGA